MPTNTIEDEVVENRKRTGRAFAADRQPSSDQEVTVATGQVPVAVTVEVSIDTRPVDDTLLVGHPDASQGWARGHVGDHRGDWTEQTVETTVLLRDGRRTVADALIEGASVATADVGDAAVNAWAYSPALTWETAADWDKATTQKQIVATNAGDRSADQLALGYDPIWLSNTLTGYWPLDEDSGSTATDHSNSGTQHNGTVFGDPTQGVTGITGSTAYDFDGTGDEIEIPMDSDLRPGSGAGSANAFTVAGWLKSTTTPSISYSYCGAWDQEGTRFSEPGYELFIEDDGAVTFWIEDNSDTIGTASGGSVLDGDWHHIAGVWGGTDTVAVFVDGTQVDSSTKSLGDISPTDPLYIGSSAGEDNADIVADDVQTFTKALTASEIQDLVDVTSSGTLTTAQQTVERARKPDLSDLSYNLNGESIDVTVTGSPNGSTETITQTLNGASNYNLSWSNAHKTFTLTIDLSTTTAAVSPTFSSARLS